MNNTAFIILVTGTYHWLVEPLVYMYEKYMPVPLVFFSDRPIPGRDVVEVFPLDMHIYKEECGRRVKDALRSLPQTLVMFGYMDLLPVHNVDLDLLGKLEKFMVGRSLVARGNLWSDVNSSVYATQVGEKGDGYKIFFLPRDDPHIGQIGATSLLPALWRKDFLLEFIEDRWTFDAIEFPGQRKFARQKKWSSVALFPGLFDSCHLCYTSSPKEARLSTIPDPEDRAFVAQFVPPECHIT